MECALLESPDKLSQRKLKGKKKVGRVTLIKGKTSAEAKITIRVLEQDKGVSFAFQSSSHIIWRLEFEERHTHSTCKHLREQPVLKQRFPGSILTGFDLGM